MARMDAGLFTLQQCAVIVAHLWGTGDVGLRKRVLMLLHQKGGTLANIKCVVLVGGINFRVFSKHNRVRLGFRLQGRDQMSRKVQDI